MRALLLISWLCDMSPDRGDDYSNASHFPGDKSQPMMATMAERRKRGLFLIVVAVLLVSAFFPGEAAVAQVTNNTSYEVGVLVLRYFPTQDGIHLDKEETRLPEPWMPEWTLDFVRGNVETMTSETLDVLERGSIYQGYKNPLATASLNYSIVDTREFLTPPPLSPYSAPFIDHYTILTGLDICDYVENRGVREVWIWMYHTERVAPVESHLSGPFGNIGNGGQPIDYPRCAKSFTTYDYNYGRSTNEAVHDHGHQIEVVLKGAGDPMFEEKFIGPAGTYFTSDGSITPHRCGWTHVTPNSQFEYDYANSRFVITDREDWKPDGGQTAQINCDRWQCVEKEFHRWRWQSMPGNGNSVTFNGQPFRNWWDLIGDYDVALHYGNTLLLQQAETDATPPTPPTNVTLCGLDSDKVQLCWEHGTDSGSGVKGYVLKRNSLVYDRQPVHNGYLDVRVTPGTSYAYEVASYDLWGNVSSYTPSFHVTTLAQRDTNPPSVPTNFRAVSPGVFEWDPSTDREYGVYIYLVYKDGVFLNYERGLRFGFVPGEGAFYEVAAQDYAGNVSAKSAPFYPDRPTVSIASPADGDAVPRNTTITISASASDDLGVVKVEFFVKNDLLCTDLVAPYSCDWSVPSRPRTSYTLQAKAYDAAGNTASHTIQVTSSR